MSRHSVDDGDLWVPTEDPDDDRGIGDPSDHVVERVVDGDREDELDRGNLNACRDLPSILTSAALYSPKTADMVY